MRRQVLGGERIDAGRIDADQLHTSAMKAFHQLRSQSGEILVPETDYEREGFVPNVVFPSGAVVRGESLLVYCGATDESCAIVEWRLLDLLDQFLDAGWRGAQ